jgi:hypothetical protein
MSDFQYNSLDNRVSSLEQRVDTLTSTHRDIIYDLKQCAAGINDIKRLLEKDTKSFWQFWR